MALYKTEAVVLRAEEFGEAHRLVTLLTPERGLVRAVAKGARRPTSRLGGVLQPFTHVRLLLWRGRSLDGVSQAEVRRAFRPLREDLQRMAAAIYACELAAEMLGQAQGEGAVQEGAAVFRLLLAVLGLLGAGYRSDLVLRYFELHLLRLAGFGPLFDHCPACNTVMSGGRAYFSPAAGGCLCPACVGRAVDAAGGGMWLDGAAVGAARGLLRCRPRALAALRIPGTVLSDLGNATGTYLRYVLERSPRSLSFWDTVRAGTIFWA